MPGVKGQRQLNIRPNNVRYQAWQSMRILRSRFSAPDLLRTIPAGTIGATTNNLHKFLRQLLIHGYIARDGAYSGGQLGSYQYYRLIDDAGPCYPITCSRCGRLLSEKTCTPQETERETDTQRETQTEGDNP